MSLAWTVGCLTWPDHESCRAWTTTTGTGRAVDVAIADSNLNAAVTIAICIIYFVLFAHLMMDLKIKMNMKMNVNASKQRGVCVTKGRCVLAGRCWNWVSYLTRSVGNCQVNFKFSILSKAYATLLQVPLITAQQSSWVQFVAFLILSHLRFSISCRFLATQ